MFDAVIFDCDGVLIDSEALSLDLEIAFLKARGLNYDRMDFAQRFIGADSRRMRSEIAEDHLRLHGQPIPESLFDEMISARNNLFLKELKAIGQAVNSLTAWTGAKAVASSSRAAFLKINLTQTGLADLIYPHVYSAEEVARGKPAPDVFLHAAKNIGVAPQKCLVIEDSINGVKAARSAEMQVWGFLGGGHVWPELRQQLFDAGAHDIVENHNQLTARLAELDAQR